MDSRNEIAFKNFTDIERSVGKNGYNQPLDVIIVQNLLNYSKPNYPGKVKLVADGKCGPVTISQIGLFQKHSVLLQNPDSKVDPQGRTLSTLKASLDNSYLMNHLISFTLNAKVNVNVMRYLNLFKAQYPKAKNINYLERLAKAIYMDV